MTLPSARSLPNVTETAPRVEITVEGEQEFGHDGGPRWSRILAVADAAG